MIRDAVSRFLESTYRDDRIVQGVSIFCAVVNMGMWVTLYLKLKDFSYLSESGQIPLHYSANFGVDSYGPWYAAFTLPLIGIAVYAANLVLGYALYYREKFLSYITLLMAAVLQAVLALACMFTIFLNS